ncbi:MAG: hypothetical protein WCW14_00775 [Candidatus Paceibacterota bacterium]
MSLFALFYKKNKTLIHSILFCFIFLFPLPSFASVPSVALIPMETMIPSGVPVGIPAMVCGVGFWCTIDIPTEFNTAATVVNTEAIIVNTDTTVYNTAQIAKSTNNTAIKGSGQTGASGDPSAFDFIWQTVANRVLKELTKSIVTWIDNGFKGPDGKSGGPSFVQDPEGFFKDTADITVGDFILSNPALAWLCTPFNINIRLSLQLNYAPFKEQIKCSLSGVLANTKDAYNNFVNGDFIGGGGWNSWIQMTTVPTNNPSGALTASFSGLEVQIGDKKKTIGDDLLQGKGFMSWKSCEEIPNPGEEGYEGPDMEPEEGATYTSDPQGNYSTVNADNSHEMKCTTETPGSVISDSASKATGIDMDRLGVAQDVNAIMAALANVAISYMIDGAKSMFDNGKPDTQEEMLADLKIGNDAIAYYSDIATAASQSPEASQQVATENDLNTNTAFVTPVPPTNINYITPLIQPTTLATCNSGATSTSATLTWVGDMENPLFEVRVSDESDGIDYPSATECSEKNPNDFCLNNISTTVATTSILISPVILGHNYYWGVWPTGASANNMATSTFSVPATCEEISALTPATP